MTQELVIGDGTDITLHFSLQLESGEMVDSTFDGAPATFSFGDGKLLPGFEEVLVGLTSGQREHFTIPPEKGFGQHNPNNIQRLERQAFDPDMELEEGLVVSFADAAGGELPGVVRSVGESEVVVDFNHPLAGRVIFFEVEIIAVKPTLTH